MKFVGLAITTIAIVFAGSSSFALGNMCADLFRDDTKVSASRAYGRQLVERAHWLMSDLQAKEETNLIIARNFFDRREEVTASSINAALKNSKTLSKFTSHPNSLEAQSVLPPAVETYTRVALLDPTLDEAHREQVLRADPYMKWLKHNALPFKIAPNRNRSFAQEIMRTGDYQPEPIELFTIYRRQGLPPEIALLRVQRNLDPDVSVEVRAAIDRALVFTARINALEDQVLPRLTTRDSVPGMTDAWYEMTSLASGRAALVEMRSRVNRTYGTLFSEAAFDRLLKMSQRYDPTTFFLEKFRVGRVMKTSDEALLVAFHGDIAALRQKLGVGPDLSDLRFVEICMRAFSLRFQATYHFVMLDVMESPVGTVPKEAFASNIVSSQMLVLQNLVDLGEALESRRNMHTYVEELGRENEQLFAH